MTQPVSGVELFNAAATAYAAVKTAEAARQAAADAYQAAMTAAQAAFDKTRTAEDAKLAQAVDAHKVAVATLTKIQTELAAIVGAAREPDAWRFRQSA